MLILPASGSLFAQQPDQPNSSIVVNAPVDGPEIKGVITVRKGDSMKVTAADGTSTIIAITNATQIKGGGNKLTGDALVNGLPVTVKTSQWDGSLVARQVKFKNKDFKTAMMIHNATNQRFDEQGAAIDKQAAATEALRGRMGDIDKYNIKSTVNVHFATGKTELSAQDKDELCATATAAQAQENALLLVVGYTDSTGSDEINQQLSEKRADRVINYLQQVCGWKPYRMLTPSGMAKADPAASNDTPEGKAQNRRVAVNVLVSKSVDGL
jgi:outer membrane protein OmpA-like peptidoglycan-associated protein